MKLVADLHTHTISSGHAYSTVMENVQAAACKGLEILAITDHGPAMPGGPHEYHFGNLKAIPENIAGVRILKGIEANVIDREGTLDLGEVRLAKLDIVLAGLHTYCTPNGSVQENTQMMIQAMKNKWVDIIVHPGNPEFPVDAEAIVQAAVEYDVALEINNSSLTVSRKGSRPICDKIACLVKEYRAKVAVGTDSHIYLSIGEFADALELLSAHGITAEQVINTSTEKIMQHLNRRVHRHDL